MKNILFSLLIVLGLASSAWAQTPVRYGYCPESLSETDGLAQGTGKNKFVAAMICLDPSVDPVMKRLKGHQVKGVRCYLRQEYKQAGQKRSFVMACKGEPNADPVKKMHNFLKGWNEVYFDEPLTIGNEKIFVGFQVFEKAGAPYPLLTDGTVSVPGGCWINLDRKGWEDLRNRGTLMIQAILDDGALVELERSVYAQLSEFPLTLEPEKFFLGKVYFKNISGEPVESVELKTIGAGDEKAHLQTVKFEPALAPFDGRVLSLKIRSGKGVGTQQRISLNVEKVNGRVSNEALSGVSFLYVTLDAFLRIPLVEEFTSQRCPNCPFMMYYVEKAREIYDGPLLYVTHHTGYQKDVFTLKNEEELLYLFGKGETFNPAIMYDRLYFPSESNVVLKSTGETSPQPYLDKFAEIAVRPAMAEVLVDVDKNEKEVSCRVYGRVNREMAVAETPLYLTVYLVEDGLTLEKYPQDGLDVEGAPEDLVSGFRHNGIIRHSFTTAVKGDVLPLADDASFNVEFPPVAWKSTWNWNNCQVIAFVHKVNEKDLSDNFVLNAGSNKYNHLITGVENIVAKDVAQVRFYVGADHKIHTDVPVKQLDIYQLSGVKCSEHHPLTAGVYVVRAMMENGKVAVQKLLVK